MKSVRPKINSTVVGLNITYNSLWPVPFTNSLYIISLEENSKPVITRYRIYFITPVYNVAYLGQI